MKNLSLIRGRFATMKPWVGAAIAISLGIVIYYGVVITSYMDASSERSSLEEQVETLSRSIRFGGGDEDAANTRLTAAETRIELGRSAFTHRETSDLISVISATAISSGIGMNSITLSDTSPAPENGVDWLTQDVSLSIVGAPDLLFSFIDALRDNLPGAEVGNIGVGSPGGSVDPITGEELPAFISLQLVVHMLERETADLETIGLAE